MADADEKEEEEDTQQGMRVCLRFRPQNKIEKAHGAFEVVTYTEDRKTAIIQHPDKGKVTFNFDRVFNTCTPQPEVYQYTAAHLVEQLFEGFNATIFAYGQTGAGKTYSMEGELGSPHRGIIPRTVERLFEKIEEAPPFLEFLLKISYVEIYLERLRDLFEPEMRPLKIRESKFGVYIEGVCELFVASAAETLDMMTMGANNRTVSSTGMNAVSSRSHGVFMLKLEKKHLETGTKTMAKLMMVDLAGSEKVSKTGATGALLEEAKKINQSLSALGNVMNALSSGKKHVSYRDSVLTRLLSDSLGGNCKTTLLIACSPSSYNVDETVTTCRFGARAKKIVNKAKVNVDKTVAEYKKDIAKLNAKIDALKKSLKTSQKKCKKLKKTVDAAKEAGFDPGDGAADEEDEEKEAAPVAEAPVKVVNEMSEEQIRELQELKAKVAQMKEVLKQCTCPDEELLNAALKDVVNEDEAVGGTIEDMVISAKKVAESTGDSSSAPLSSMPEVPSLAKSLSTASDAPIPKTTPDTTTSSGKISEEEMNRIVESVRMPLIEERQKLMEKVEQMNRRVLAVQDSLSVKEDQLRKARLQKEEMEARCDALMLEQEFGRENTSDLQVEIKRLKNTAEDGERKLKEAQFRIEELVDKVTKTEREAEKRILKLQNEQDVLVKDLMETAKKEIARHKKLADKKSAMAGGASAGGRRVAGASGRKTAGVTKMHDHYVASIKEVRRVEEEYEAKLREFEDMALENMYKIKMEHLKMKQSLETQTHLYLRTKMELMEARERVARFEADLNSRDCKIRQQNEELEMFGEIKRRIEKVHKAERKEALDTIAALKEQIRQLESMPDPKPSMGVGGRVAERVGTVAADVGALAMKRRRQIAKPIRGGAARAAAGVGKAARIVGY